VHSRPAILLALVLVVTALAVFPAPAATADDLVVAQDPTGPEDEAEGQEGQGGAGEGQVTAEAETGAGGQTEGGGTEAGPPWTYQMARLSLVLLVALALGIGLMYYRLVARRQRGEI
jgi:hypothetical protein